MFEWRPYSLINTGLNKYALKECPCFCSGFQVYYWSLALASFPQAESDARSAATKKLGLVKLGAIGDSRLPMDLRGKMGFFFTLPQTNMEAPRRPL